MRHLLLSTAAAGALLAAAAAVPATAADLPMRAAPAPTYAPMPTYNWSGLYIGANAGTAFHVDFEDDARFTGGLTLGLNWQISQFVLGLEGDINYLDREINEEWFGTLRGRVGVAFDRALIYATGGAAFLEIDTGRDTQNVHATVGGGVEFAVADNVTVKIEYLHIFVSDDDDDNFFNGFVGGGNDFDIDIIRAGVNFKFNLFTPPPPPAPVYTRG
ncbi:MAG TPA: outer membrane protein [Microvirga sp.]|nr:outer membrane protein [Microvirga sp.]